MKKIFTIALAFAFSGQINAQTFAQDWTHASCSSDTVNLFSIINNEEVVIMEFGMGCSSCTIAAQHLMNLKADYAIDFPGKVHFFYMDYWAGNDCANDVAPILASYAFDKGFDHCNNELAYYMGGSPMPAIVIAAGSQHVVIYEKNSFALADTANIDFAVRNFFANVGINEGKDPVKPIVSAYPNPTNDFLNVNIAEIPFVNPAFEISDVSGRIIYSSQINGTLIGNYTFPMNAFQAGMYFVRVYDANYSSQFTIIKQ